MDSQQGPNTNYGLSLESISSGELWSKIKNTPDQGTLAALNDLDHENLKGLQQDRLMRKDYADKIYGLVKGWLSIVGIFILLSGFGKAFGFFTIEASVLTTLVGGTTLGVVGLFATVAKYLFNEKQIK